MEKTPVGKGRSGVSLLGALNLIGQGAVALLNRLDKLIFDIRRFFVLLHDDAEPEVLRAILERNVGHIIGCTLIRKLCDSDGVEIGGGEKSRLLHPVIDIDDFGGIV